jgi:hypothetical protein
MIIYGTVTLYTDIYNFSQLITSSDVSSSLLQLLAPLILVKCLLLCSGLHCPWSLVGYELAPAKVEYKLCWSLAEYQLLYLALGLNKEHLVEGLISPAATQTLLQTIRCCGNMSLLNSFVTVETPLLDSHFWATIS